jgi:hypothetical protein
VAVVTDSPSKAVAMVQTKHSTAGGNLDGHTLGGNYTNRPFSLLNF